MDNILLMGNPNVGKSVFFSELTGLHAVSSNFAGTTVSYMEGPIRVGEKEYRLIDVPGTYSLTPTSAAEAVAVDFVDGGAAAIICVLDAANLERNLHLALELTRLALDFKRPRLPIVYALNLVDVADRRGLSINVKLLEQELGAPVVETVAVRGEGMEALRQGLAEVLGGNEGEDCGSGAAMTKSEPTGDCAACPRYKYCKAMKSVSPGDCGSSFRKAEAAAMTNFMDDDIFTQAKNITRRVSKRGDYAPAFLDKLSENMMKPLPGIPIALLVVALLIGVVVGVGEVLRAFVLEPLVDGVEIGGGVYGIVPFFDWLFSSFIPEGVFLNILVGEYGIFVISFEWILAAILPYVFLFYLVFSFLEDTGYLPRLSVLFDNVMRKLGVQGGSLIYALMGLGCAVPAIIGTRAAASRKERIVVSAAICFAVPCISQTGALISLFAGYSAWLMAAMIGLALLVFMATALIAGKLVKGSIDPLILEIPNLLLPERRSYFRKLSIRLKHFMMDAEVPMLIAIVAAALLKESGLLDTIAAYAEPLVSRWLGLPSEAVIGLLLGIIRREMSVAPLLALNLTPLQAFVGGAVALLYLPCLSVFAVLVKEFKLRIAATIGISTIVLALLIGGLINHIALLFS